MYVPPYAVGMAGTTHVDARAADTYVRAPMPLVRGLRKQDLLPRVVVAVRMHVGLE
jgi:hypothetical protein